MKLQFRYRYAGLEVTEELSEGVDKGRKRMQVVEEDGLTKERQMQDSEHSPATKVGTN